MHNLDRFSYLVERLDLDNSNSALLDEINLLALLLAITIDFDFVQKVIKTPYIRWSKLFIFSPRTGRNLESATARG